MVTCSLSMLVMSWVMLAPWLPSLEESLLRDCERMPELLVPAQRRDAPPVLPGERAAITPTLSWVRPADWSMQRVLDEDAIHKPDRVHCLIGIDEKSIRLRVSTFKAGTYGRAELGLRQWLEHYVADVDAWLAAFKTDLAFFDYVQTITPKTVRTAPAGSRGLLFRLLWTERHGSMVRTVRLAGPAWVFHAEVRTFESRIGERWQILFFKAFDETGAERAKGLISSEHYVDPGMYWTVLEQLAASASSKPPAE